MPRPLMLVPVELTREGTKDGAFRYSVTWTGEDLQTNLSLQKKLLHDFHLNLPDLDNEDSPEDYCNRHGSALLVGRGDALG